MVLIFRTFHVKRCTVRAAFTRSREGCPSLTRGRGANCPCSSHNSSLRACPSVCSLCCAGVLREKSGTMGGALHAGARPASPPRPVTLRPTNAWMTEEAMRAAFIGKTLDGHYVDGLRWTETYGADGRLDYRERARKGLGHWYFRGHVFCTFYDPGLRPQRRLLDRHQGQRQLLRVLCCRPQRRPAPRTKPRRDRSAAGRRAPGARASPRPARTSPVCKPLRTSTARTA